MAVQRIVKMTFQLDKCDDFQVFFTEIKDQIQAQPGCSKVVLLKDNDISGVFFTYSVWDKQSSLEAYRSTDFFAITWPRLRKWFAAKPEAWSTEIMAESEWG